MSQKTILALAYLKAKYGYDIIPPDQDLRTLLWSYADRTLAIIRAYKRAGLYLSQESEEFMREYCSKIIENPCTAENLIKVDEYILLDEMINQLHEASLSNPKIQKEIQDMYSGTGALMPRLKASLEEERHISHEIAKLNL